MNLDYPPDREAYELLELAARGLHAAAGERGIPYLMAVQIADPAQPEGVASHLVTNMHPVELRRALLSLLARLDGELARLDMSDCERKPDA